MSGPVARRTRLSATVNSSAFELLKDAIVVYLVVTRGLKAFRHLRARGISQTVVDSWKWISRVAVTWWPTPCKAAAQNPFCLRPLFL
ncbi:uncharacterized protein B0H18DRAFT_178184 [Fomitopsis serialis]|uniref:uncharacterized protein n=1 Tax=Fomitopsis serialis TaxID=139415 RepID=UPI002008EAE8|nr:uncharacterized protein B0H18DRAFT_178184 [Neoantrodia serialis]KAH9913297.1 hypothetical protein B0H18DRAFT_178184 [Neoantrodia serialis]